MTDDPNLQRLQAVVARIAGPTRTPPDAGPDTALGEDGYWLDSVAMLEVIVACEQEFGVTFDWETELTGVTLGTVRSLATVIRKKMP